MKNTVLVLIVDLFALILILAANSDPKIDPDVELLKSYSHKTLKNIWKDRNSDIRFYFEDGSYLKFRAGKYHIDLDTVRSNEKD